MIILRIYRNIIEKDQFVFKGGLYSAQDGKQLIDLYAKDSDPYNS